jgi:hypothetical protein
MENEYDGIVYNFNVPCFEERIESEYDFFERVYQFYISELLNNTEMKYEIMDNFPASYRDLTVEQTATFQKFIEDKKYVPIKRCFPYQYIPSNFYWDEVNAHSETLKANSMNVFTMEKAKVDFYYFEIDKYKKKHETAKKYEIDNNINSNGYEK